MENRFDLLGLLMLQKEGKTFFGDSCGASKNQQAFAVMTAAFAELTAFAKVGKRLSSHGGTNSRSHVFRRNYPCPFLAQLVSPGLQARVWKELSLGMGGEGTNVFPFTSAPA